MVLVFLKKKIMCCAVNRSGNFKMLVLLYQLLIGQSLAQLVERCTNVPVSQRAWVRIRTSKLRTFWMVFRSEGSRRKVNLSTFLRQSFKAKRWM